MEPEDSSLDPGYRSTVENETDSGTGQRDNVNEQEKMNNGPDVEKASKGRTSPSGLGLKDKYIVDWDGDNDPACPRNWSLLHKWANLGIVSCLAFLT
jgi:hypothetical protein